MSKIRWPRFNKADLAISDKAFVLFNIELTNRCPFKCVMCARTHSMTRAQGDMTFDMFSRAIDEYAAVNPSHAQNNILWLHGFGESTVHPRLAEFMAYATRKHVKTGLSVNPLMLTPVIGQELLSAGPATLYLSLDGHDNDSFETIRGLPAAYEKSKERLFEFLKLKRQMGSATHIVLSMINFDLNKASIEAMEAEWRHVEGIDQVLIKPFTTWDGSVPNVTALKKTAGAVVRGPKILCRRPFEVMSLCWNGNVTPCCYDFDEKVILGNIGQKSLADIWNDLPMQNLRREFLNNNVLNPLCRLCPDLYGTG